MCTPKLERHHAGASSAVPRASLGQELGKEPTSSYSFPPCAQRYGFTGKSAQKRVLSIDGFQTLYTYYIFPPLPYNRVACEACAFNVRRTHSSPRYSPKCQEKHRRCHGGSPVGVFATEFWRRGLRPVKGSRIVLPFPVARGRALVFPARMPDSHRLPFAIVFGPRVVRYRLNTHLPRPHHICTDCRSLLAPGSFAIVLALP